MKKVINMLLKLTFIKLAAYSHSIDKFIAINEKDSRLRKTGVFSKASGKCL